MTRMSNNGWKNVNVNQGLPSLSPLSELNHSYAQKFLFFDSHVKTMENDLFKSNIFTLEREYKNSS